MLVLHEVVEDGGALGAQLSAQGLAAQVVVQPEDGRHELLLVAAPRARVLQPAARHVPVEDRRHAAQPLRRHRLEAVLRLHVQRRDASVRHVRDLLRAQPHAACSRVQVRDVPGVRVPAVGRDDDHVVRAARVRVEGVDGEVLERRRDLRDGDDVEPDEELAAARFALAVEREGGRAHGRELHVVGPRLLEREPLVAEEEDLGARALELHDLLVAVEEHQHPLVPQRLVQPPQLRGRDPQEVGRRQQHHAVVHVAQRRHRRVQPSLHLAVHRALQLRLRLPHPALHRVVRRQQRAGHRCSTHRRRDDHRARRVLQLALPRRPRAFVPRRPQRLALSTPPAVVPIQVAAHRTHARGLVSRVGCHRHHPRRTAPARRARRRVLEARLPARRTQLLPSLARRAPRRACRTPLLPWRVGGGTCRTQRALRRAFLRRRARLAELTDSQLARARGEAVGACGAVDAARVVVERADDGARAGRAGLALE
mmetsp:Transcript_5056/g.11835  ORF Transcript_5056/g.11835 Transcript_5056/m.11835 type:complete len:482 (+) Transcript_5056:634-2079(+)